MKRFVKAALYISVLLGLVGCFLEKKNLPDYVLEWSPVVAHFKLVDQSGNDLLDPGNPENISDKITLSFRGETYYPEFIPEFDEMSYDQSGWDKSRPYQLIIGKASYRWNGMPGGYWLYFGEIAGEEDMDEDMVLAIEGKTQWVIHYHCSNHDYGTDPTCDRSWTIDGKATDSSFFFFTVI